MSSTYTFFDGELLAIVSCSMVMSEQHAHSKEKQCCDEDQVMAMLSGHWQPTCSRLHTPPTFSYAITILEHTFVPTPSYHHHRRRRRRRQPLARGVSQPCSPVPTSLDRSSKWSSLFKWGEPKGRRCVVFRGPKSPPKSRNANEKHRVCANFFEKCARTFAFFPVTRVRNPTGIAQKNLFR